MKISIIIPFYNAEKYLERCIKSVLDALEGVQGEVLLIDNNSTDNSLKIAKKCQNLSASTIKLLSCPTAGAAAARNFGAKEAKGEYIWFIDADDYIDKSAVAKLLGRAYEKSADIVMMGAKRLHRDGSSSYLSAVDANKAGLKSRFVRYGMGPWQVIIRRSWWLEHDFRFREGIIHEDMELMSALILYTDKFASIDEPLYYYCDNAESVLHKSKFNSHIFDIFPALMGLHDRFEEAGAARKYHAELEWFFIWNLLIDSAKDFAKFPEGKPGFRRSREMLKAYFPAWRKNQFLREKPLKLRIRVRMNYYR